MSVLVTGAAGFVGSHVVEQLLARGDRVVGLDNLNDYYAPERKRHNLFEVEESSDTSRFVFVNGDIRDRPLLQNLFEEHRFEKVVHLAAMAGVRASVDAPWLYYEVNLTGTLNLLECVRHQEAKANFVFASTSSAYGASAATPFVETDPADRPLAPYPASKRAAEQLGHSYHHLHGVDFTALRFFTVYGPRGRPDMMAFRVLQSAFTGQPIPYFAEGKMFRDWTFVGDIAQGVLAAADRRLGYEIINLGRGEPLLVESFVDELSQLAGKRPNLVPAQASGADMSYTCADISKARSLLGYAPRASVKDGTAALFAWYQRHGDLAAFHEAAQPGSAQRRS